MPSIEIAVEKIFISLITQLKRPFQWAVHKVRLALFRFRNRKPPVDNPEACDIAYSILGGRIDAALAYRNLDSPHIFIAVVRRSSDEARDNRVYILEQIGETYRSIWKHEPTGMLDSTTFKIKDIDHDGNTEVTFQEDSFGSGAGTSQLMIYSASKKRLSQVSESYNWQDATSPVSPEVEIEPECDPKLMRVLEQYAVECGFLQRKPIDLDSPEFAIPRWHKENGNKRNGKVNLYCYEGSPPNKAHASLMLDTDDICWFAYFKGPLFGHHKSKNKHFIAYSPAWIYNWVTCLVFDGERLWFGIHIDEGLLSFRLETQELAHYTLFKNRTLPSVTDITFRGNDLIINGQLKIPCSEFKYLKQSTPII